MLYWMEHLRGTTNLILKPVITTSLQYIINRNI